jgi:REP element-mobilizing transposase RayT/DNA-binding transcriptional regulator YdaS (Cro superfamily)
MVRGIQRCKIFRDDQDRHQFLDRLGGILEGTGTVCYAWALIPNHLHLLLRTGDFPIASVMRRLLTGYAVSFNRRHRRCGHLFQDRYKSILCQEDAYLLELVRYIHLNPLRAKLVADMAALGKYPFCGHSGILGTHSRRWQDVETVLAYFGAQVEAAKKGYHGFVSAGIDQGRRWDLTGGGLIRSTGGWVAVQALKREKVHLKSDERILGDGDFVEKILFETQERYERQYPLKASGVGLDEIAERVAGLLGIESGQVWQPGKSRIQVQARSLLCYWAVRELGQSVTAMSRRLGISTSAVSKAVARGAAAVDTNRYKIP